jgi:hypothetical protein
MAKKYVVTGACVTHVPVDGPEGKTLVTLYQNTPLPEGVPEDRIQHLLDNNLIAEAGSDEAEERIAEAFAPNNAEPPQVPAAGKTVNGRSSKTDLVEHAVSQGMTREEAEGMTRDDLLDRYVRKGE